MSRLRYLVSYDICDPKRLRKVARSLEGFGVRLQYSVFECPLDEMRLPLDKALLCLQLLTEGNSIRSTCRLMGTNIPTVLRQLTWAGGSSQ